MSTGVAGERFGFVRQAPRGGFPDSWRDIDRAVWRWVLAHGGDEVTAAAAAAASCADGQGHSALPLSLPIAASGLALTAEQRQRLARCPWVTDLTADAGAATAERPLVLDGEYLYLLRNHRAETAVAQALVARREAPPKPHSGLSDADLRALFNGSWSEPEARQREAVRAALGRRLMVLTGGPGTGKTTTVLRMLLALSRAHQASSGRWPQLRIAAPTGKAAQRLAEALRQGSARLQGATQALASVWTPPLQALLNADAATVHRLLGSRGRHGGFGFHHGERLPADIVVVDEASMLDLGLLRALLAALRDDATLVLVGDADQLTSVGTGSVLLDIVQALEADPRGDLVRLTHCFRADSNLLPIIEAVRGGHRQAFAAAMAGAEQPRDDGTRAAAVRHPVADPLALRRRLNAWADDLQQLLAGVGITQPVAADDQAALAARLAILRRQQLLCALREGPFGALQAAATLGARLRSWDALAPWSGGPWYPGRSVIITRNDHAARLYNGDVGLCLPIQQTAGEVILQVAFESPADPSSTGQGPAHRLRLLDPTTLPPHQDAFALTVHKSQGSEYDHVAVLLPADAESPLLTRQTLYTGLSRARQSLELWSVEAATAKAIETELRRYGQLAQRCQARPGGRPE